MLGVQVLHPTTLNGDAGWKEWPDRAAVLAELGLNAAQLDHHVTRGHVTRYKCPDAEIRFKPFELEILRARIADQTELTQHDLRESNSELKDVLKQAVALLKQSELHNEKMFELITKPINEGVSFLINVANHMSTRLHVLEAAHDDVIEKREQLLTMSHDRELATMRFAQGQERWKEGIGMLKEQLGPIAEIVAGRLGIDLKSKHPAVELIESLDPALADVLESTGVLSPQQLAKLRIVFPRRTPVEPEAAPPAPSSAPFETVANPAPEAAPGVDLRESAEAGNQAPSAQPSAERATSEPTGEASPDDNTTRPPIRRRRKKQ